MCFVARSMHHLRFVPAGPSSAEPIILAIRSQVVDVPRLMIFLNLVCFIFPACRSPEWASERTEEDCRVFTILSHRLVTEFSKEHDKINIWLTMNSRIMWQARLGARNSCDC